MRRLGIVENIVYDGTVLVRAAFAPATGAAVADRRHREVGTVARVFGPVREPFVTVRPKRPASPALIGTDVFLSEGKHAGEKNRRGRGSHSMPRV